ncbi:cation:proton antiporter [Thermocrinis sp.]
MHSGEVLVWVGGLFSLLFITALLLRFLRVPYILSFMLAGFLGKEIFPEKVLDWVALLEHSAVVFLFFFIGLEYSFERLWKMKSIVKPGIVDFALNFFPVFFLSYLITKDLLFSSVVSSALYPSSTSIVAKLLSDYKRLVFPEADLLIGILIFEDLVSVVLLSLMSGGIGNGSEDPTFLLLRSIVFLLLVFFLFYLLRNLSYRAVNHADRISQEPIFSFMIVGFLLLLCGAGELLGISSALVAFMLGVLVPEQSITYKTVEEKLSDLKELALGVFFFGFTYGSSLSFEQDFLLLLALLPLSLITKAISTYIGARLYGLGKKASVRASLSFLPRGEFSLIFASLLPITQPFVFLVVFFSSILGSMSFVYAPKIASMLKDRTKPKGL